MNPISPNSFKNLIPSLTASVCDKLSKLFQLPAVFHAWVSYVYDEGGNFTDAFKADLCAIDCGDPTGGGGGGNPENPSMPSPTGISATDGTYSDKVVVTWNAVTAPSGIAAVTQYKVYRALSTITNPNSATLLATISVPTTTYEDASAVQGTTYNYWVVATNGTQTSNFGGPDVGHADAPEVTLPAVSDLIASRGWFYLGSETVIFLGWTAPTGATHYDIYRGTTSVFANATKIESDIVPGSTTTEVLNGQCRASLEGGVNYYDDSVPSPSVTYYYWVVAKKSAPPAVSAESNTTSGWVTIGSDLGTVVARGTSTDFPYTVPGAVTKMRLTVTGKPGSGAGGGSTYGGGGGGGGGMAQDVMIDVTPGDIIDLTATGSAPSNAAAETNGVDGRDVEFTLNGVAFLTIVGGKGGVYDPSGGGAGGLGGTVSGSASHVGIPGTDGEDASGGTGGRGGQGGLGWATAPAHYNGWTGFDGNSGIGGSGYSQSGAGGSWASITNPTNMTGGKAEGKLYALYAVGNP
jgi:hypothetical protein